MKRRAFLGVVGGAAAWPLTARAQQQPTTPVVGFVHNGIPELSAILVAAFRDGLSQTGYIEGQNVAIEYRWARNDFARLPELMVDVARKRVAVIAYNGDTRALATITTIPIVFNIGFDPVQADLVASFARPGGNVTGITTMNTELGAKWLGLFHDLLPSATRFAALVNPNDPTQAPFAGNAKIAALAKAWQIEILEASTDGQIDTAFAIFAQKRAEALLIAPGSLFLERRSQLAALALRHAVPAIYAIPAFPEAGGLMSYGSNYVDTFRQVGVYVARVLKGEKTSDLPVLQPTKLEFVINLTTAKTLGLTFPPGLLAIADRVIE
jgi:putative ABC transport system substrate-binding protein